MSHTRRRKRKAISPLKDIYLHHRLQEGHGILSILLENEKDIKVSYLALDVLNEEMKTDIIDRINKNNMNIVYFYLNTIDDARLVETDIRDIKNRLNIFTNILEIDLSDNFNIFYSITINSQINSFIVLYSH